MQYRTLFARTVVSSEEVVVVALEAVVVLVAMIEPRLVPVPTAAKGPFHAQFETSTLHMMRLVSRLWVEPLRGIERSTAHDIG